MAVPVSSCHGIVATLRRHGFLYSVGRSARLYPTRRLLDIANAIVARDPLLEILAPRLEALRDATGETVILGKPQGDGIIYLAVIEGPQTIRYSARVGDTKPLHSSAIGKAVLGAMPPAERVAALDRLALPAVTPNTITDRDRLAADLAAGRRRGWFVTEGENVADVCGLAAATRLNGETVGIAIAGPLPRMGAQRTHHAGRLTALLADLDGEVRAYDAVG